MQNETEFKTNNVDDMLQTMDQTLVIDIHEEEPKEKKAELEIISDAQSLSIANNQNSASLFSKKVMLAFTFLIFIIFTFLILYKFFRVQYEDFYRNYRNFSFYNTISIIVFLLCILLPQILPKVGRGLDMLLYFFLIMVYAHCGSWCITYVYKTLVFQQKIYYIIIFTIFSTALGTMINTLLSGGQKYNPFKGIIIGFFFNMISQGSFQLGLSPFKPKLWEIFLILLMGLIYGSYLNFDILFMQTKRGDDFLPGDWYLGLACLHTDIFYNFWKDVFSKTEEDSEDISNFIEEQQKKEKEMNQNEIIDI